MDTYFAKKGDIERPWFVVDADGVTLGRLSTQIAKVLMGKNTPAYTPHADAGGFVVVINAGKVSLTGNKWTDKMYRHHTGYPGALKEIAARDLIAKHPTKLLEHAVRGMLPKNKIGDKLFKKLKVYAGPNHPHQAQNPGSFPANLD